MEVPRGGMHSIMRKARIRGGYIDKGSHILKVAISQVAFKLIHTEPLHLYTLARTRGLFKGIVLAGLDRRPTFTYLSSVATNWICCWRAAGAAR
jgi:hypothetical protein